MEFLVLREKKEKQVCWGPIQAQKGALVYQVSKETGEFQACLAFLAGRGPWEMLDLKDPQAPLDSRVHQVYLGLLSLAQKETEVPPALEEIQVSQVPLDLQDPSQEA